MINTCLELIRTYEYKLDTDGIEPSTHLPYVANHIFTTIIIEEILYDSSELAEILNTTNNSKIIVK